MTKSFIYAKTMGMTKKSRKIFFWIAVSIFFIVAPLIVLYAQGYRVDFSRGEITQVGAIIVESNPKEATVWFGEKKLKNETPLAIPNLLPFRFYNVKVEKEGFSSWEKNLLVRPEKITPIKNIVLFPEELKLEARLDIKDIESFHVSPNAGKILVQTKTNVLSILDMENRQNLPILINLKDGFKTFSLDNFLWSENSDYIVFSRKIWTGDIWYFFNAKTNSLVNLTKLYEKNLVINSPSKTPLPAEFKVNDLVFLDGDSRLVANVKNILLLIDPEKEELSNLQVESIDHLASFKKRLLVVKSPNVLMELNENGESVAVFGNISFDPNDVSVSPDGNKFAFLHEHSVGVMWLTDLNDGQLRAKGDQEIIYQTPHVIEKFWWHAGSEYIIVLLSKGDLIATELDGRGGKRNSASWQLENIKSFSYSQKERSLWSLSDESILEAPEDF